MISKGLYNNCENRYDFHRLHDLNLPPDFIELLKDQAQKIACIVHQSYLTKKEGGWGFTDNVPTLAKQQEMMLNAPFGEDEAFQDQFTPGFGTAFLVTKQLALTAAHCICDEGSSELNMKLVEATKLVFGFHDVKKNQSDYFFTEEQVRTVTVVAYQHFRASGRNTAYSEWTDWALLKLDREVAYDPLPLNLNKVVDKIELYMLGHPNGLSLKFTYNGQLEGNTESDFFECKLDAFRGNSGSPVFNRTTSQIEGILIEGTDDYEVVPNYRGTGQTRIQTSCISESKIVSNQIGKRMENCQRLDVLRHLVDKDLLDLENLQPVQNASSLLVNSLKECYKSRSAIPRLLDKPMPIDTIYTELVLLCNNKKSDKVDKEKENKSFEEHRINSWEDIHATKEPIKLDALFENREGKPPKKLLILGRAGIGKSTLCQYIANQWAEGKLWKGKFDALFWVPLRKLQNVHSAETAASILFRLCCQENKLFTRDVSDYLKQNPDRVLLVLDGLDEITLAEDSRQKKILDELLKFPHWILTSRPHAAGFVKADDTIENVGYASKTIDLYIQKSFQENPQAAIQKIHQNPIFFGLCHIPINLELICAILKKTKGDVSSINSMTSLYEKMMLTLQRRFLEKIGKPEAWNWTPTEIAQEVDPIFKILEKIAWTAMKNGALMFSLEDNLHHLCTSGFLQSTQDSEDVLVNEYSFLHLTFQEFFAARYLAGLLRVSPKEASKWMQEVKFNPRYKVVMWFTSGLLRNEGGDYHDLNAFFDMLDTPKDLVGLYGALLKVRCLEECGWQKGLQEKIKACKDENIVWIWREDLKKWDHSPIKKRLLETFEISLQSAKLLLIPKLISSLSNASQDEREFIVRILGQVGQADAQTVIPVLLQVHKNTYRGINHELTSLEKVATHSDPQVVIPVLLQALKDESECVRSAVILYALGKVGKANPQMVIPVLLPALNDKSESVRRKAVHALGKIGRGDPRVIPVLISILEDLKDIEVRNAAVDALSQLGQANPQIVITELLKTLKNDNFKVRQAVIKILGQIGSADPQAVIPELILALEDKEVSVRRTAAEALGQRGGADPQTVIFALISALKNGNFSTDSEPVVIAIRKIAQVAPKTVTLILSTLLPAFKEEDWMIISSAVDAIDPQTELFDLLQALKDLQDRIALETNPQTAIPSLLNTLKDKDCRVRVNAVTTLGKVGVDNPQAIVPSLLNLLKNKDEHFRTREAVITALYQIGQVDPQTVIHALFLALKNKDWRVKHDVVKILGIMGWADPQKITLALLPILKDEDYNIRETAIQALVKVGQADPQTMIPLMLQALKNEDCNVREGAAKILGKVGHANPHGVIPNLLLSLKDENNEVRRAAVKALGEVGHASPQEVILSLVLALKNKENESDGIAAINALGKLGLVDPHGVIPALVLALQDEIFWVRKTAILVLGKVGQAEPLKVIPKLLQVLKDKDAVIRKTAVEVLSTFDFALHLKDNPDILTVVTDQIVLSSTPLTSLITCWKKNPSLSSTYSAAITKKCIEENLPLFQIENTLCFYEQGRLLTIDFPDARPFAIQIEKRVPEYPEFSNEKCSIQ
ncbi:MAG: HEAT repeat domain-containing protein [Parachlamydiaceae bacterium]|nr:HEAT repeat domain-containing protein [Parachlamydiaceae bacterium]